MIVNMHKAKSNLSKLVQKASQGESIVIAVNGDPKADLVMHQPTKKRIFGTYESQIKMADDFDEPEVNREIENLFEKT